MTDPDYYAILVDFADRKGGDLELHVLDDGRWLIRVLVQGKGNSGEVKHRSVYEGAKLLVETLKLDVEA